MFKAPARYAPHVNLPAARARANVVLDNLVESGFMTEGQVFGARRNPATAIDRRDDHSPNYYLDWAFDEMKKLVDTFPNTLTERVFVVRTALDLNLQRAAETAVENSLRQYGRDYHASQAATVLADLDGAVRAMVGGRDYASSQFNRATDALRQPGSSFKPYVYATALSNGFRPTTTIVDQPICLGNWCPQNYGRSFAGTVTLTQAITASINTIPVRLSVMLGNGEPKAGRAKIIQTARSMGIRTSLPDSSSLPIGAAEVNVLGHTVAFATFPNQGKVVRAARHPRSAHRRRRSGLAVRSRRNEAGAGAQHRKSRSDMNMMLNKAAEEGTGKRAILDGVRIAGKTGTTNAYRDAWFVGYTGNFVCGVWVGNDDYSSTNRMTGGSLPAMTWHQIMTYAHAGIELKNIPGVAPNPPAGSRCRSTQSNANANPQTDVVPRPPVLTRRGADILVRIERLMDDATRALVVADTPDRARSAPNNPRRGGDAAVAETAVRPPAHVDWKLTFAASPVTLFRHRHNSIGTIVRLLLGLVFAFTHRHRGRPRRDLVRVDARNRVRGDHDRRLDGVAEDRHRRRRSLCARRDRAQRRTADRLGRRRRVLRVGRRSRPAARRPLRYHLERKHAAGALLDADALRSRGSADRQFDRTARLHQPGGRPARPTAAS